MSHSTTNTPQHKSAFVPIMLTGITTVVLGAVGGFWLGTNQQLASLAASETVDSASAPALITQSKPATSIQQNVKQANPLATKEDDEKKAHGESQIPSVKGLSDPSSVTENVASHSALNGFSKRLGLMQELAQGDIDSVEVMINALINEQDTGSQQNQAALTLAIMRLIELDATRATDIIRSRLANMTTNHNGFEGADTLSVFESLQYLPIENSEVLLEWAQTELSGQKRHKITAIVLNAIAGQDPILAMDLASSAPSSSYGMDTTDSVLFMWSQRDPGTALDWYVNEHGIEANDYHFSMLFESLARADIAAAENVLLSISDYELSEQLNHSLISALTQTDPQAAISRTLELDDNAQRYSILFSVIQQWSMMDSQAALNYIDNNLSGEDRDTAMEQLAQSAHGWHPESLGQNATEAFYSIAAMPVELQENLKQMSASHFMGQDPEGTLAMIESIADPVEQEQLYATIAWQLPHYDMARAKELFNNGSDQTREMLAQGITQVLYQDDPQAAWQFYYEMPDSATKQQVVFSLISNEAHSNPMGALEQISQFNLDDRQTQDLITMVFFQAASTDPVGAEAWLQNTNVGEELRPILESALGQAGQFQGERYQLEDIYFNSSEGYSSSLMQFQRHSEQ